MILGAHISTSGGYEKAVARAESLGCTAFQIFTKSNRQWAAPAITAQQAELFRATVTTSSIAAKNIVVHASYLINIGSSNPELRHKSQESLIHEINRCQLLGIDYLVLHPGSATGTSEQECLNNIITSLDSAFTQTPGTTKVLLETMAGQGSSVCYRFEQIAYIMKHMEHARRVAVCVDTCHIFAAGYDFRTPELYKKTWDQFDAIIGLEHLAAFHLNDSKKELGSRVDRHEDIGKGQIGLEAFGMLMNDKRFAHIPKLLETPETTDIMQDYARNLTTLSQLI
jgi:deoxyribonuclease IV